MRDDDQAAPVTEHLRELRQRLIRVLLVLLLTFIGCFFIAEDLYRFLVQPLADITADNAQQRMIYTGLTEVFFTYMKVAFYGALFVSFPFMAIQLYLFLAPGLYKQEKFVILPFLVAAPVLFILGGGLVYYFIFPLAWEFFMSFESLGGSDTLPIQLEARVSEYLSLVMQLIFAFGIAFQLPILLCLLVRAGFLTVAGLQAKRKYALVIIVTVAAILTPPDVISQIGLALSLVLLYELSIVACRLMSKKA